MKYLPIIVNICLFKSLNSEHNKTLEGNADLDPTLHDPFAIYDQFPTAIHKFRHRRDIYTNQQVRSGLFELFGENYGPFDGKSTGKKKLSYNEFHRILQCPRSEPGIEGNRGSLSLVNMIKPSKETIRLLCLWAETHCGQWDDCQQKLKSFNASDKYDNSIYLMRIINETLYYDWPWKRERQDIKFQNVNYRKNMYFEVLDKIHDIGDSVFLISTDERPLLEYDIPFPALGPSPSIKNMVKVNFLFCISYCIYDLF